MLLIIGKIRWYFCRAMRCEDHSPGLVLAALVSSLVYCGGLVVNVSDLVLHYNATPREFQSMPDIRGGRMLQFDACCNLTHVAI